MKLRHRNWLLAALCLLGLALLVRSRGSRPAATSPATLAASAPRGPGGRALLGERARAAAAVPAEEGIAVRVDTAAGAPAAGARVTLFGAASEPGRSWERLEERTSDGSGRARFPAEPGRYLVEAHLDGAGAASALLVRPPAERLTSVVLVLGAAGGLRGHLVSKRGEPVPLGRVRATRMLRGDASASPYSDGADREQVADAGGRFAFEGLEHGAWRLVASAPGHASATRLVAVPGSAEVELRLDDAAFLQGRVEDEAGRPVAAAVVTASSAGAGGEALTGAEGTWSLEVPARAFYLRAASPDGRAASLAEPVFAMGGETVVAPVLRLTRGARLSGVVARRGGREIAGAKVSLSTPGAEAPFAVATTDARGTFALRSLPAGLYLASAAADGFRSSSSVVSIAPGQEARAEFLLLSGGAVRGTVRDSKGAAVAGAFLRGGSREAATQGPAVEGTAVSGEDGRYLLDGLSPGQARVMALRPGSAVGPARIVEVPEDGLADADFVLGEEGLFEGHVSVAGGKPLAAPAKISLRLQSLANDYRHRVALPVDGEGMVRATLPVGDYSANANLVGVRVGSPGVQFTVSAGETVHQEFVLPDQEAEGQITVTVQEAGGAPAAGATAIVRASMGAQKMVTTAPVDASGVLRMGKWDDYPVDTIEVTAVLDGRAAKAVVHRPETSLALTLGRAASLHGRLRGAAREGFTIFVSPGDDGDLPYGVPPRTFSGSAFAFADLPAAPTLVRAVTSDGRSAEQRVVLLAGQDVEVLLDLQAAASVFGRTVDGAGAPLPTWLSLDNGAAGDAPAADGRFSLGELAAGDHVLEVQAGRGYQTVRRKFTLKAGERLDLGDLAVPLAPAPKQPRRLIEKVRASPAGPGALSAR